MMILLIVIPKMMLVSFNSNIMLPLLEQELLTIPDQMTSDTNCPLLVANCLFCCFRGSSKSIIHMLSKDVPILTQCCNSRTTTCFVINSKFSLRQFYDRHHYLVTRCGSICVTNNHGYIPVVVMTVLSSFMAVWPYGTYTSVYLRLCVFLSHLPLPLLSVLLFAAPGCPFDISRLLYASYTMHVLLKCITMYKKYLFSHVSEYKYFLLWFYFAVVQRVPLASIGPRRTA